MSMESWLQQKRDRSEQKERADEINKAMRAAIERTPFKANHDQPEPSSSNKEANCSAEYTGGHVSYYKVRIDDPLSGTDAYVAECNDIIEALGMNYAEGNAFKAIWRMCAARTLGKQKKGYTDGLYDAEKVAFFGARMVEQQRRAQK